MQIYSLALLDLECLRFFFLFFREGRLSTQGRAVATSSSSLKQVALNISYINTL